MLDCCTGVGFAVNSGSGDHGDEKEVRGDDARDWSWGDTAIVGAPHGTWSDSLRLSASCCEERSMYVCKASVCARVSSRPRDVVRGEQDSHRLAGSCWSF